MVCETMISPLRERPRPVGTSPCRSPIIVLDGISDGASVSRFAGEVARRSAHDVVLRAGAPKPAGADARTTGGPPAVWLEARKQFPSVCVGVVAVRGSGVEDAGRILADGLDGGLGPGAIALLGFDHAFAETCFSLVEHSAGSAGAGCDGRAMSADLAPHRPCEWPPMMIFLPDDDPVLAECALACRRLRAIDIPVRLEVMRSAREGAGDAALDELVVELDRFFAAHLVPRFPMLL